MTHHSLLHLLRHKEGDYKLDSRASKSPKSPRSPRSPRSSSTPDLSKTERNQDFLNQCAGCSNVEILVRRKGERSDVPEGVPDVLLHNSFEELDKCARRCEICRIFRQALILEEVTFDGVKELQHTPGQIVVRWQEDPVADGEQRSFLRVAINGQPRHVGSVNCEKQNSIGHLALCSDGLNPRIIEQAKDWLDICLKHHIGQCDNLKFSSESPRLLIDILSAEMIQLRQGVQADYVALSYCWGNPDNLSKPERQEVENGKTKTTNLKRRREPFSIKELPTTVRDALHFIHAMGIRYAWVDTLCIIQDDPKDVGTMHKIYSNALFTLCACATTRATAQLLEHREAWSLMTEPCRLGGQWLTTPDMSLNELRLRSPLAERAWTLQEERLSPRMLYVSSNRVHWSCAESHEMEMKPTYGNKEAASRRPIFAASDRNNEMPLAQEFLLACYSGTKDLHSFWADIIKSYSLRSMSNPDDRLTALSGLAAKYLSASKGDEYLAGLWSNNLAEGLAWKVNRATVAHSKEVGSPSVASSWPSWSWAVLPLQTPVETNANSASSASFHRLGDDWDEDFEKTGKEDNAITQGQQVKRVCVTSRMRQLWDPESCSVEWVSVSRFVDGEEKFTFAAHPEQEMHSIDMETGRVLIYENRKREVIGQLDFWQDVKRVKSGQLTIWALELGVSTMLLLERGSEGEWRRVGVAWNVREDYFASAETEVVVLR